MSEGEEIFWGVSDREGEKGKQEAGDAGMMRKRGEKKKGKRTGERETGSPRMKRKRPGQEGVSKGMEEDRKSSRKRKLWKLEAYGGCVGSVVVE